MSFGKKIQIFFNEFSHRGFFLDWFHICQWPRAMSYSNHIWSYIYIQLVKSECWTKKLDKGRRGVFLIILYLDPLEIFLVYYLFICSKKGCWKIKIDLLRGGKNTICYEITITQALKIANRYQKIKRKIPCLLLHSGFFQFIHNILALPRADISVFTLKKTFNTQKRYYFSVHIISGIWSSICQEGFFWLPYLLKKRQQVEMQVHMHF